MKAFSLDDIKKSAVAAINQQLFEEQKKPNKLKKVVKPRNDCPEVQWMHWQIKYWCLEKGLKYEAEYKFNKGRKWKFDFAIPDYKIGIEYEGINSQKSRHTSITGYTADTEKYNTAQGAGWKVLRFTVINYKTILQQLNYLVNESSSGNGNGRNSD
jgi:very-short-patch-repair endonuclease